ncbi:MAG: hypothetical protein ABI674_05445 [Spartobacteria bacterium]
MNGLLFFALTRVASAQTIWNTQSGDWFQTANWSDAVPDSATDAQINNGGTPQIDAAGATANNLYLGFGALDSGSLLISGAGTLQSASQLAVGYFGTGMMTVSNGGNISDDFASLGNMAGSQGAALVDGAGSAWTISGQIQIGSAGSGELTVSNGASVANLTGLIGDAAGSEGNVLVDGPGSSWTNSDDLSVGNAGIGSLTIQGGATVSASGCGIGVFPDTAAGSVVVDGIGSTLISSVSLTVGSFGVGTLTISNGGTVTGGMASIGGGTPFGGGSGNVMVDGLGSTWNSSQSIGVEGSLTVQNGGTIVSDSAFVNGSVVVDGAGSTWTTGQVGVASSDYGNLTIRDGGFLESDDISYVGATGRAGGIVIVDGFGSKWNADFDQVQLYVGFGYYGALNLTAGGVVSAFAVGVGAYGVGEVTIDGAGSALNLRTNLYVGGADFGGGPQPGDTGLVQIANDGAVSCVATTVYGHGTLVDDGSLTSASVAIAPGGLLRGNGSISGDVSSSGQIAPGDSLGTLTIVGNLTQDAASKLIFEISGTSPDAQSHLSVTVSATLDGTVEVRFTNGFLPVQGQVFELVDVSGTVSGSFAQVIFPDLRSGFQFSTQFVSGRYQITALSDGAPAAGLLNISTRGQVGADDDALIAGFIVTGTTVKQVLIRGLGPSLAAGEINDLLDDPTLELRDESGALITANDNWMDSPERQAIIDSMLAPGDDSEAAILATLAPGSYTAILRGAENGTGLGIVEVYNLGPDLGSSLANISTRGLVQTGDQVLIGGFIVDDQNSTVLLRGLGPSLPLAGLLANPTLELHDSNGDVIAFNDDWQEADEAIIRNTGLAPLFNEESAILATLGHGAFTAILRGLDESSGVGLFEVYNLR